MMATSPRPPSYGKESIVLVVRMESAEPLLFSSACTQVMCSFWQPGTWDMAAEILNTLYTVLQARGSGLVVSLKPLTSLANAVHITATQATVDAIALLATLSGSSEEEKISAAFRAYDKDGNGFISQQVRSTAGIICEGVGTELLVLVPQDMESYLTSVFHVYFSTRSDEKLRVSPEEAAQAVTEACFDEADIAHNGSLSYQVRCSMASLLCSMQLIHCFIAGIP